MTVKASVTTPATPAVAAPAAPVVETPAAAPTTATDYQAAALAALESQPAEAAQPAESSPEDQKAADPAPESAKEEDPKPEAKVEEKPEFFKKSLQTIAEERSAIRKEREAFKAEQEAFKADRARVEAFDRARTSNDPLAALQAAGFSYNQLVQQIMDGTATPAATKAAAGKQQQEGGQTALEQRLAALEAQLSQERAAAARGNMLAKTRDIAKTQAEKFVLTSKMGVEERALTYIEDYYTRTRELPGGSWDNAIPIALEAVEAELAAEADKWRGVLTPGQNPVSVPPAPNGASKVAVGPQVTQAKQSKTLTNSQAAPVSKGLPTNPQTPEDYQRLALAAAEGSAT